MKMAGLLALAVFGAWLFGRAPVPVAQLSTEQNPVEVTAIKSEAPSAGRGLYLDFMPAQAIETTPHSYRDDLAKLFAEVAAGTNVVQLEFQAGKLQAFVERIPTNDFATVFRELAARQILNSTAVGRDLQLRLLERWSLFDIHATVLALDQVQGEARSEAYARVATAWARQELPQSVAWAQQLPEGADRQAALLNIAYEAVSTDPKAALTLASQVSIPPEKNDLVNQAAANWAAKDPDEAANWAGQIQDQPLREQVLAAIATSLADTDPYAAAQLVLGSIGQGQAQEKTVLGIVQRLTFKDAASAKAWVAQFPAGPLQDTALAEINRIAERQQRIHTSEL